MKKPVKRGTGDQKKSPAPDDPKQSRRFEETARELGADEEGQAFSRAMEAVLPAPTKKPAGS